MAKKEGRSDKKKNVSFTLAAGLLCVAVIVPIVLFVVSVLLHGRSTTEFSRSLYPIKYEYYVETYAKEFDVDVCLVYGVIRTESGFDPDAVSQAGAIGLMQIMPDTFTWLQNYRTEFMPEKLLDSSELYKPQVNIEYGTYLLRYLLDRYDGDVSLAIIAYNAGYGNVDNWLADGTIPKSGVTSENVPFTETSNYLDRVTGAMEMYRTLYYDELGYYSDKVSSAQTDSEENAAFAEDTETDSEFGEEYGGYSDGIDEYAGDYGEYYTDNEDYAYAFEGDGTGYEYYD